jgi:hypothetical protein
MTDAFRLAVVVAGVAAGAVGYVVFMTVLYRDWKKW